MANPFEGNQFALKLGYHLNKFDDTKGSGHVSRSPGRGNRSPRRGSNSPLPPEMEVPEKPCETLSTGCGAADTFFPKWELPRNVADVEPLKDKIRVLEATVTEYEQHKVNVIKTFGEYRERVAERERKLEAEYSAKIVKLSDDVLAAKKDFEERMKSFQALQEKFENEKETALEKLKSEHQKEIQLLAQRCSETQLHNLEQKYMIEIQRLEEERKSLKSERAHLGQAFESKLRRAQTLYEKELIEAKSLYSKELEALKEHEDNLKDELLARQDEFRDRLEQVQIQFQQSREELAKCGKEVQELGKRLEEKEAECQALSRELEAAKAETEEALEKLRVAEGDLDDTKQKHHELEQQLTIKQNMLSMLEGAKAKLEALIQDMQVEVRSLKNKVAFLENERKNLESQSETQAQLQNSQVQALEAVLENLTREKDATKDHFEHLVEQERIHAEEREYGLKKEYTSKLHEVEKENKDLHGQLELMTTDDKAKIRKRLADDYEKRLKDLQTENKSLEEEVESLRTKLHRVLQTGADGPEPAKLRKEMTSSEISLKKCQSQLSELIAKSGSVSRELDHAKNEIAEKDGKIEKLEKELKTMASKAAQTDADHFHVCDLHKDHADEITLLQAAFKKDFEAEKKKIRKDLQQKFEDQNKKSSKELEISFQEKLKEYEKEIKELRAEVEMLQAESVEDVTEELEASVTESSTHATVRELNQTITDLNSTVEELHARIQELEVQNVEDLRNELVQKERDKEEMASLLADTKMETEQLLEEQDIKIKNLMDQIKENKKPPALSQQEQKTQRDEIERELRSKFAEAAAENHVHEVEAFEKQLQVIKEQADEKEKELENELKALKKESSKKNMQIENLNAHVQELLEQIEDLNANLDSKAEEIKHFNKKTDEYIRKREQQQVQAHNRKIISLKSEHETELQKLKEREETLLKDLEEYKHNSNDKEAEDISAKIAELQEQVSKKEDMIEKLQSELHRQGSTGSSESTSNKDSPTSSMHSDSRKPSVCSTSGMPPTEKPMCKKAANLALVHKWQCLVHQLTTDTRRSSTDAKATAHLSGGSRLKLSNKEKSPTPEVCERQGRSLSRGTPTASTTSLKPPDLSQRSGKSPTRPGFLKPKSVPLDKRPAWRF